MVMLICENYFNKHILPLLHGTVEELTEAHSLFCLSATNNQVMLAGNAGFVVFRS